MLATSLYPESWSLIGRDIDPETGHERCHVRQRTTERVVVYRLIKYPGASGTGASGTDSWCKVGDLLPHFKGFRRYPERRGVKLSNSRMDLTLLSFCVHGHGNAYV